MNNNGVNNINNGNNMGVNSNVANTGVVQNNISSMTSGVVQNNASSVNTTNSSAMSYGTNVRIAPPTMNGQGSVTTTNTNVNANTVGASTTSVTAPILTPTVLSSQPVQQSPQQQNTSIPNGSDKPVITAVIEPEAKEAPNVQFITKKSKVTPVLFMIVLILGGYILYSSLNNKALVQNLTYNCTPISSASDEKKLDLDSTLVKDLYSKVYTNVREDVAQPEWNDTMKLYLAYRQLTDDKKYDSNCNLFNQQAMNSYTCVVSTSFVPKAFKQSDLELEWKKLFGEKTPITFNNIKLDYDCIGGYQYIADREEYVQGYCESNKAISVKATKKLLDTTSNGNTIILKEEVNYSQAGNGDVPEYLKNGTYYYTFRLDMNYNYVLVSKTYQSKY